MQLIFKETFLYSLFFYFFISGNPQGSHTVRTARELILDNFNNKDKQEEENSEIYSEKKTVKDKSVSGFKSQAEKNGIKTMDIGDNQTITFADKSVRGTKVADKKAISDKMMMVREKVANISHGNGQIFVFQFFNRHRATATLYVIRLRY